MQWRSRNAWPLHFCYLISCSKRSKAGVEKNSPSVISKASHNFLIVTVPGFWLSPFKMLFIVDCETADKFARPFDVIWCSLHSSRIRAAMVSCVVTFTPPQAIYHYDHKSSWRRLLVILALILKKEPFIFTDNWKERGKREANTFLLLWKTNRHEHSLPLKTLSIPWRR